MTALKSPSKKPPPVHGAAIAAFWKDGEQRDYVIGFACKLYRSESAAHDFVAAAIVEILDAPEKWNGKSKLKTVICGMVWHAFIDERRSAAERHRDRKVDHDEVPDSKRNPEKQLRAAQHGVAFDDLVEQVRAALAKDELGLKVFESIVDENRDPETRAAQAERFGVDVEEISKARKRIAYAIEKLAGEVFEP
jgi:DNA-directed RNA polymerase specialized sigma24 family protein